jgi:hypothetical protein
VRFSWISRLVPSEASPKLHHYGARSVRTIVGLDVARPDRLAACVWHACRSVRTRNWTSRLCNPLMLSLRGKGGRLCERAGHQDEDRASRGT